MAPSGCTRLPATGEALRISDTAWVDPFAEPLEETNRQYVRDVGKWTAFDVSNDEPYAPLHGSTVTALEPITSTGRVVVGVEIQTTGGRLRARMNADELWVQVE